ncbi:hypothetical protein PIB30_091990 [Stylosanthes scabra]|uniref:SCP domain-containing protein n=1 Tax=Stylosanthes scabra TaxID=79078 RepID=A0ABU6UUT6_9FABA|nr:hypothetical protein [Stylosanthes scabra]
MARLQMLLILTSFLSIFPSCLLAQNSPQDYLEIHNAERAAVGVKPLLWDFKLESEANMFVSKHIVNCMKTKENIVVDDEYGHNVATYWKPEYFTGIDAMALWLSQKRYYNYESSSCIGGDPVACLAYSQVVSNASIYLGCARGKCQNGGTLVACFYYPRGQEFRLGSPRLPRGNFATSRFSKGKFLAFKSPFRMVLAGSPLHRDF